ncbi:MAG: CRISPR-associated protein Csx16 [Methanoregula sp.]|nr:CRISPR-associated protein Csx16 [Methanoregula sp.]
MIIIVTRHSGAIEWLKKKGYAGEVQPHVTDDQIAGGNIYIGSLPLQMISTILQKGSRFFLLDFPAVSFTQRGQEMTPEEMDRAGARLIEVKKIEMEPIKPG